MPADGQGALECLTGLGLLLWAGRRQGDAAGAQDLLTAARSEVGSGFRWGAA